MTTRHAKTSTAFFSAAREMLKDPSVKRMNGSLHPSTATFDVCCAAKDALQKHGLAVNFHSQRKLIELCVALAPIESAIGSVIRLA
jgi:phage replication-related protein YjqB (UPF0714/DUF867 family)